METNSTKQTVDMGLNIIDLVLYLLSKWVWYIIFIAICVTIAWYRCAT